VDSTHGFTVDHKLKMKGYAISCVHLRTNDCGRVQARAAACAPKTETARRRFAGVGSGEGSWPPFCARVGATRRGGARAHV
jgi:hypothetical protein